jgi:defect-in-organelle-trafficking protein DotB
MVIQQRLLPKVGGGREAIKEWLNFDSSLRSTLFKTPLEDLIPTIEKMVETHGHSLLKDAQLKYDKGLIYKEDLEVIQREKEAA